MATQNAVIQCECGRRYTISVVEGDAPVQKPKRTRVMSEADRKATGIRLQTARAAKLGLTLEQYRELHLRPGQKPTAEDIARVTGKSKAKVEKVEAKPKAKSKK